MKNILTDKEKKEDIDITLGRLRGIMKNYKDERGLAFVNKVIKYIDGLRWPKDTEYSKYYCERCNAFIGDGHDCDNCHFCNTAGGES